MPTLDVEQMLAEAERLGANGQYRAALALLDALPSQPEDPVRVGLLRGRVLVQQGHFDAAIDQWRAVLAIQPDNQEVKQALALAMRLKDNPARSVLLRANWHLAIQYVVIFLLGGVILLQAFHEPNPALDQNKILLHLEEQQERQAGVRLEKVLHYFQEESAQQRDALEKRLASLEQTITAMTVALQAEKTAPGESLRAISDRLTALEHAGALLRETLSALGARQEERITALGMVIGEIGAHISVTTPPQASPAQTAPPALR